MTSSPTVSVIMNCYNGEKYLREAVDSVLAQTYQDWEIVFWDNQSTDRSAEIFRGYGDPRLKYFYAPTHLPLYGARNHAIARATGAFLAFLDVDDWWLPEKLARQVPLFADPEVGIVCGNFWVSSERKNKRWIFHRRPIPRGWVLDDLLASYFPGLLTLVVRKSAIDTLSYPCDPRYHMIGDLDLVVRLSVRWKLDAVQDPIAVYRKHESNDSARHIGRHVNELRCWMQEMAGVGAIRASAGWRSAEDNLTYYDALLHLLGGDRATARRLLPQLSWGPLKARLALLVLSPDFLVRRLKN